ncbi:uncharacterized protein LOC122375566 [Amphibalanus amphitrite]|uniref:uncharacterized protein LOC122375566 n=1 Tax=Amphibalanus amphitrite TaxID=1232801 RepID=UPI001C914AAC|nr:uncharacterized protein LOC122375566 [Amphibalanus amphitrite]
MRLIATSLLVAVVSSAAVPRLPPLSGQLSQEVGEQTKHALRTLKLVKAQLGNAKLQLQNQASLDTARLISAAESEAVRLLLRYGRTDAVSTVHQAAQALHALADGATDVESGLQSALTEILMVMHQLGAKLDTEGLLEETTPKSQIDILLEELQGLVDKYLLIIAPFIGLTEKQALQFRREFDKFVADVEALEHGQVPIADGLAAMITDVLEMLRILGIDWIAPTSETPTELDALLAELDSALTAVLDILGPVLGFSREKTEAIEADIDQLIADIEDIEHGRVDVDTGLEIVLQDILDMLHDFGFSAQPMTDDKLSMDSVLEGLQAMKVMHR